MTRRLAAGARGLRLAGGLALDALLPPRCLSCGEAVLRAGLVCARCWSALHFLGAPCCRCCGFPFDYDQGEGALCAGCSRDPPPYARARAALAYDEASRPLILAFKHADRTEAAASLALWMRRAGAELLEQADVIVPVPLHRWRLFRRRYNQSALLALALGRAGGRAVAPDLLHRRRNTASQGHLSPAQRRRNVAGAFRVAPRHRPGLAGRRVLLVDDVITTGATAAACTRALLAGGAAAVDLITLARVLRRPT